MKKRIATIVLAAALLVSMFTIVPVSANSITWDLDDLKIKTVGEGTVYINGGLEIENVSVYQMNKQDVDEEEGSVTIGSAEAALWRAANAAECDVTFPEAIWQGQLNFATEDQASDFADNGGGVAIGRWNDSSSSFYVAGYAPDEGLLFAVDTKVIFWMAVTEFTVPEGDWLAFAAANGGAVSQWISRAVIASSLTHLTTQRIQSLSFQQSF